MAYNANPSRPAYYVTIIIYEDHERLPGLIKLVEDAGCVVVNKNCTMCTQFTFLTPKGVKNPIEKHVSAPGSNMQAFVNMAKNCFNPEAAQPPQLEQPVVKDFGNED